MLRLKFQERRWAFYNHYWIIRCCHHSMVKMICLVSQTCGPLPVWSHTHNWTESAEHRSEWTLSVFRILQFNSNVLQFFELWHKSSQKSTVFSYKRSDSLVSGENFWELLLRLCFEHHFPLPWWKNYCLDNAFTKRQEAFFLSPPFFNHLPIVCSLATIFVLQLHIPLIIANTNNSSDSMKVGNNAVSLNVRWLNGLGRIVNQARWDRLAC